MKNRDRRRRVKERRAKAAAFAEAARSPKEIAASAWLDAWQRANTPGGRMPDQVKRAAEFFPR